MGDGQQSGTLLFFLRVSDHHPPIYHASIKSMNLLFNP